MSNYEAGLDVLGFDMSTALPFMNIISSAAGGLAGGATGGKSSPISSSSSGSAPKTPASSQAPSLAQASTHDIVRVALEQERQRRALEQANTMKWVAIGTVGIFGLGALALVLRR